MTDTSGDGVLLHRLSSDLEGVERALARLDAGDYGACEVCGQAIEDDQLIASPTLSRCLDHRG